MPTALIDQDPVDIDPPGEGDDPDDHGGDPVRWATAATFWTPPQAHLAILKLESEGFDCQLANENIIATDFLLAPAVGGIRILVPEEELEAAQSLLSTPSLAMVTVQPTEFGTCPECGSANIGRPVFQAKTLWAGVIALMLCGSVFLAPFSIAGFVYYVIMWRPWRCGDCGEVFRRGEDRRGFPVGQRSSVGQAEKK
jgi:hypothetical protein